MRLTIIDIDPRDEILLLLTGTLDAIDQGACLAGKYTMKTSSFNQMRKEML
jgi:hypothetical protein